jgi:hypothetical protein
MAQVTEHKIRQHPVLNRHGEKVGRRTYISCSHGGIGVGRELFYFSFGRLR